jgi:large subunit ribosomal protein L25
MSLSFELNAEVRSGKGTGASRRLRREKKVPGVIYGAGKDPVYLAMNQNVLLANLEHEPFYSHILSVKYDGQEEKAVLKDLHRHPFKPEIMHFDLQRVSEKTRIRMSVPLHFIGEDKAPGVKKTGGIVNHMMTNVDIICLARDLPIPGSGFVHPGSGSLHPPVGYSVAEGR